MEKTLSLGAFEELSENEVMGTEGGDWWSFWYNRGVMVNQAKNNGESINPISNFVNGTKNYITIKRNQISNACMPSGVSNPNYIWDMY